MPVHGVVCSRQVGEIVARRGWLMGVRSDDFRCPPRHSGSHGASQAWLRLVSVQHVGETPGASHAVVVYAIEPTGTFVPEFTEALGQLALRHAT